MDDILVEVLRFGFERQCAAGQASERDLELFRIFTDESVRRGLRPLNYRDPEVVERVKSALEEYEYRSMLLEGKVQ